MVDGDYQDIFCTHAAPHRVSAWRRFLWALITLQIVAAVFNILGIFLQCIPFEKFWDLLNVVHGSCWSTRAQSIRTIVMSVINIITDFVFAALLIGFLRKVHSPMRERLFIGMLMGLGVLAGVASTIKITTATQFGRTRDTINESVVIGMWPVIEEQIRLIAISVPSLSSPVHRVLHTFGGLRT
jgi:VanZ family protein